AAAMLAVPNAFQAQEAGFNVIGRVADIFPNYLLSAYSVRRSWAEKNRLRVVHFLKAVLLAKKWFERDRKAAAEFLAKEFELKPSLAEKGLDYYLTNLAWHPELDIEMDGLKTVVDIYAEQTGMKGSHPQPGKIRRYELLKTGAERTGLEIVGFCEDPFCDPRAVCPQMSYVVIIPPEMKVPIRLPRVTGSSKCDGWSLSW